MPGIAIGNYIGKKLENWAAYWAGQSEVLFFGEVSKITDGKLYNQKSGATDYLTVTGAAGSYTFQCPNTAPYIAADTDQVWHYTDDSIRAALEADLVGYDFTRSIIKYEDASDYSIEAIMILSSDVDTARMRNDFHLSIFWDDTLSDYGYLKGNRGAGQSVWTPLGFFDEKTIDLLARLAVKGETPTEARQTAMDVAIKALRAASLFETQFDALVVTRGTGAFTTKENWIKDSSHALGVANGGTLTYTEDVGYNSDGTNSYLRTQYIPSSGGVLYKLDDACFGFKIGGTAGVGGYGALGGGGANSVEILRLGASSYTRLNSTEYGTAVVREVGYNCLSRAGSVNYQYLVNAATSDVTAVSTALPAYECFLHSLNNTGGGAVYFTATIEILEMYWFGKQLSQANFLILQGIMNTYFASL